MVQSLPMVQLWEVWVVDCCFKRCILKRRIRLLYYSYRGGHFGSRCCGGGAGDIYIYGSCRGCAEMFLREITNIVELLLYIIMTCCIQMQECSDYYAVG